MPSPIPQRPSSETIGIHEAFTSSVKIIWNWSRENDVEQRDKGRQESPTHEVTTPHGSFKVSALLPNALSSGPKRSIQYKVHAIKKENPTIFYSNGVVIDNYAITNDKEPLVIMVTGEKGPGYYKLEGSFNQWNLIDPSSTPEVVDVAKLECSIKITQVTEEDYKGSFELAEPASA